MLAFKDITVDIDEPSNARMNFRTKPRIKDAIHRAAALSGMGSTPARIHVGSGLTARSCARCAGLANVPGFAVRTPGGPACASW